MKKLGLWIVMAAMQLASGAKADQLTNVQQLLDMCNGPYGSPGTIWCAAYIAGVGGGMEANGIALSRFTPRDANVLRIISACGVPTVGAGVQAFKNWAQAHPELWTLDSFTGVMKALQQTWPCP
jgi:hypothetical protein